MLKTFPFVIAFLALASCIKEIDGNIPNLPTKVVVNCLFNPDSVMTVHVSLTAKSTDNQPKLVSNAELWLYENGALIQYTNSHSDSYYSMNYYPKVGKIYSLKVKVPDFDTVFAQSSIPENCVIQQLTCELLPAPPNVSYAQFGGQDSKVILTFDDDASMKNFYELSFLYTNHYMDYETHEDKYTTYESLGQATEYVQDLSILNDSDIDFYPSYLYFSDNLFNGTQKKVLLRYVGGMDSYYNYLTEESTIEKIPFSVKFKTVSSEYFKFRKSWTRHSFNQNGNYGASFLDFFMIGDPVTLYSNVQGGLGVFAGFNQQLYPATYVE